MSENNTIKYFPEYTKFADDYLDFDGYAIIGCVAETTGALNHELAAFMSTDMSAKNRANIAATLYGAIRMLETLLAMLTDEDDRERGLKMTEEDTKDRMAECKALEAIKNAFRSCDGECDACGKKNEDKKDDGKKMSFDDAIQQLFKAFCDD